MPEEKRPAADLTDGQIRVRVAAGERVLAHAPASVHEQQRLREQQLADLTRGDVLAQAESLGTDTDAAERQAQLAETAEAVQRLDDANTARAHWLLAHAETLNAYDDAHSEAQRRGLVLGAEPDRAAASDWLEEQRAADHAAPDRHAATDHGADADADADADEDALRPITEADVDDRPHDLDAVLGARTTVEETVGRRDDAHESAPPPAVSAAAGSVEVLAAALHAKAALDKLADQASQDAHADESADEVDYVDDDWYARRTGLDDGRDAGDSADRSMGLNDGAGDGAF